MRYKNKLIIMIFLILFFMMAPYFLHVSSNKNIFYLDNQIDRIIDGQILFAPYYTTTTYLINENGLVNHTWPSNYRPFTEAYWLGNGTILRPIISGGGGIQKILWDGTIEWDFRYTISGCTCHHDIEPLPNGNVLMIVWEDKTRAQAIEAGRDPNSFVGSIFTPDKVIEVKPTGPTSGDIVWEWHVWDHLIQDFDPTKDNYGVVGDYPELIDINYGDTFVDDWLHTNSIDYHPQFDQILLDVHNFNEIWVIDHSTTTAEAAGHTGGNSGKGGDILYRWGNPESYDAGNSSDQKLFFQHDASWIKPGYPGEGNIIVFNNGNNRPSGQYSTIDEFTPPVDSNGYYYLQQGSAYGPDDYTWSYIADPPTSFFSAVFGGAQRLLDGNTLICYGVPGKFYEVSPDNTLVWQWTNPYPYPNQNSVFKIEFIPTEEPQPKYYADLDGEGSLSWYNVKPGETVFGSFQVQNIGDKGSQLNWFVNTSSINWGTWSFNPSSGEGLKPEDDTVTVEVSVIAPNVTNSEFSGNIRIENQENSSDFDLIPAYLKTPKKISIFQLPIYQFIIRLKCLFSDSIYYFLENILKF